MDLPEPFCQVNIWKVLNLWRANLDQQMTSLENILESKYKEVLTAGQNLLVVRIQADTLSGRVTRTKSPGEASSNWSEAP